MRWWIKTWGIRETVGATAIAFLAAVVIGQTAIPVPTVIGGPAGELLVVQLLGVLPVALLLHGFERGDIRIEAVATRSSTYRLLTLAVGAVAACWLLAAALRAADVPQGISLARNITGFLGVALILRAAVGTAAATTLVGVLPLACAAAGWGAGGGPRPWAWPVHPYNSGIALIEVAVLLAVGCALASQRARLLRSS